MNEFDRIGNSDNSFLGGGFYCFCKSATIVCRKRRQNVEFNTVIVLLHICSRNLRFRLIGCTMNNNKLLIPSLSSID